MKNGHEITMLTTTDKVMERPIQRTVVDGINVIYINIPYENDMGIFKRLLSFLRFMFKSLRLAWKEKDVDMVLATSTPLTVGFPALVLKRMKKIPFVFEVRDLWPEVPIQMGALKNGIIIGIAKWFERRIYKKATRIVALSPGMEAGVLQEGIDPKLVSMIPNMSKIDAFWPRENDTELLLEMGLKEDSFKVIYFGAMGLANAMDYVMDGITLLKDRENIEFLFLGHGAMEKMLKAKTAELGLKNVHFFGNVRMEKLSKITNFCNVSLVTFSDLPILATNSPNKLFDSLSAGKALIVNSPGWTKDLVENYECGVFVDPKKPSEFSEKIIWLMENPETVARMGENSRKLAETKYDKSILCKQFATVIAAAEKEIKSKKA